MKAKSEKNKLRVFFVAQRPMANVNDFFVHFDARQNELFYGFYLLDAQLHLKKMRPLFFFPLYENSFWQQLADKLGRIFLWRGVYSRLRSYSFPNPQEQILALAKQEKKYNRYIFLLESFQACPEYFLTPMMEKNNVIIFSDQNGKLAGIYLAKGVALEDSIKETNALKLYKLLEDYYEISLCDNLVIHYKEQDIALSLLCLQELDTAIRDISSNENSQKASCYDQKAYLVKKILEQKEK